MKIGYARVSTADQSADLQIDAIMKAGCEKYFEDKISGGSKERPGLDDAFSHLRNGDTLVVWRLDRLGRSLKHLIEIVNELKKRGIHFQSIHEAIDTSTAVGQLFFHITGAFAEFEKNLIQERTKAGLEAARARGIKGGRNKILKPDQIKMAKQLHKSNKVPVKTICEQFGISRSTFYRMIK